MRIFIAGAGGFLGACAAYHFGKEGWEVHAGVRHAGEAWRLSESRAKQVEIDITDSASAENAIAAAKPDVVANFATYGAYPGRQTDVALIRKTNVDGVKNLLFAAGKAGVKRFVQIGTSSEYGMKNRPIAETDAEIPDTDYAKAKLEATRLALAQKGFEAVVVRPFSPFGHWEEGRRLVPTLAMSALSGVAPKLSSPHPKRDFMFVEDLMEGVKLACAKKGIAGEIFNISMGRQMSVGEMAGIVHRLLPDSPLPQWGSVENPRTEPPMWQADISKAKKMLGWSPKIKVEDGVRKTIEWFKTHGKYYGKDRSQ